MKPEKSTPRRSMVLRSACQGDCTTADSGTTRKGEHHHHHHHDHVHAQHSSPNVKQLSASSLKSTSRGSSQKRTIKTQETVSKEVISHKRRAIASELLKSPEKIHSVVEKVLDFSLAALSPIAVASQKVAEALREENGMSSANKIAENYSRSVATSVTTSEYKSSFTNLTRSRLMSNHLENSDKSSLFALPTATVKDWAQQNGSSSTLKQSAKTHYSDYSSADESDETQKTDYTYAKSASYCLDTHIMDQRSPNMSRPSIHSSRSSGSGSTYSYQASVSSPLYHHAYQPTPKRLVESWNYANAKYANFKKASLTYGLDSDSEEELDVQDVAVRRQYRKSRSLFSVLLNVGECILPVQTVWQKFWVFVYWILASLLLWDTWILSRRYFRKWFLPLLLLLLLPLCLWYSEEDSSRVLPAFVSRLGSFSAVPTFLTTIPSLFPFVGHSKKEEVVVPDVNAQMNNGKIDEMILKMHNIQQAQLSRPDIEEIVRSVVKEEIVHLSKQMNGQEQSILRQAKSLSDLDLQLSSLETQMKLMLAEELKNAKEKILSEYRTDHHHSFVRLQNLEKEMDSLKDNIQHIKETQSLLLETNRNCCRNHTYDPVLVENQVATVLLQIMGQSSQSGKSRTEFKSFAAWLKSSFVGHDHFSVTSQKINEDLEALSNRMEMTAKSVAAAAVSAALLQQQQSAAVNLGVGGATGGLTEIEVRQVVRDALVLYDADKTGKADFALESGGGSVISTRCSETYHSRTALVTMFGIPLWFHSNSPRTVIQPGVHPGECWAFKGSEGYLVIQLSTLIQPTAFSMEHISRSLAPNGNIDSAPREFSVFGLTSDKDLEGILIGRYTYDADGEPLQYFLVKDQDLGAFPIMELQIHSNHGNLDYTCLYRFRVHGNPLQR